MIEKMVERHEHMISDLRVNQEKLAGNDELLNEKLNSFSKQLNNEIDHIRHTTKNLRMLQMEDREETAAIKKELDSRKIETTANNKWLGFFVRNWYKITVLLLIFFALINEEKILSFIK